MWKDDFQFLTLLLTKLWNTLMPNSLDKLMQLISMKPHICDLDRGKITDLDKFLKKPCSVVLNYSYLKILKLKIHSIFLVMLFCAHITWWQHFTTLPICVFFSLSFSTQNPQFLSLISVKNPLELTKDLKWSPFAK